MPYCIIYLVYGLSSCSSSSEIPLDNEHGDKLELKVCTCKKSQETQDIDSLMIALRFFSLLHLHNILFKVDFIRNKLTPKTFRSENLCWRWEIWNLNRFLFFLREYFSYFDSSQRSYLFSRYFGTSYSVTFRLLTVEFMK